MQDRLSSKDFWRRFISIPARTLWVGAFHFALIAAFIIPSLAPQPAHAAPWTLSARAGAQALAPDPDPADPPPPTDFTVQPIASITFQPQAETTTLLGEKGGVAPGFGGRIKVVVPEGAAVEDLEWHVRTPGSDSMPPNSPSGQPFEILAFRQKDATAVTRFEKPLVIEIHYDEKELRGEEASQYVVYFDTEKQAWLPLPSEVDEKENVLRAETTHLTVFDTSFSGWEVANLPSLHSFQVSPFTGAATYSLPLWMPPGPGGLSPSLELTYNSQTVETAIPEQTQASWVGMGWNLDTGGIERNQNGTPYFLPDDTFSISAAGVSSVLIPGADGYYHTSDESFWRIQYANDTWTAWAKDGTKYIFGDTDATRAVFPYLIECPEFFAATWRWALHKIVNIHGQELTFNYFTHVQPKQCSPTASFDVDVHMYPESIEYTHAPGETGFYKVVFERELRTDTRSEWFNLTQTTFYQLYRLKNVRVERNGSILRQYDFTYASTPVIFPNAIWDSGGPTLALASVTEKGLGGASSLPPTTFTYNGLHLVQGNNGYGGSIAFDYEDLPWYSTTSTISRRHWKPGCLGGPQMQGYNGGAAWCDPYDFQLRVRGQAYMAAPSSLYQPGAYYQVYAEVSNVNASPITVKIGLNDGVSITTGTPVVLTNGQITPISGFFPASINATHAWLHLDCSNKCRVMNPTITLMPSRYRVIEKQLFDGVEAQPDVFTYRYDEAAMNDSLHSAGVGTSNPYTEAYSEFRGHAMVQEIGPDGRVSTTYFHQDDLKRGRSAVSLVSSESFHDSFQTFQETYWNKITSCGTSAPEASLMRGDYALKLPGDASFRCVQRSADELQDGEGMIAQFLLSGSASEGVLALETGVSGQASYRRFGVYARSDGSLVAQYHDGTGLYESVPLYSSGGFARDQWYVLALWVDEDYGMSLRIWKRDDPGTEKLYSLLMTPGLSWRTNFQVKNGAGWLDTYAEGKLYQNRDTFYATQSIPTGALPYKNIGGQDVPFTDLWINFVYVTQEEALDYEGDAEFTAARSTYSYDSYGNRTRVLQADFDAALNKFRDYRLDLTAYYPNNGSAYLVGYPALQNRYACPADLFNGECSSNYPSFPPDDILAASSWHLYDGATSYSTPPTTGRLTAQRTLLRWDGGGYSDPRFRDETYTYDAWGNRLTSTAYNSEGTYSQLASQNPQTASATYDAALHTFAVSQQNALGQVTTWTYDLSLALPLSLTGPNGPDTAITVEYDGFGRLTKVIRPGDSSQYPTLQAIYYDTATPFKVELKQRIAGTTYTAATRFYNGLGQLIQSHIDGAVLQEGTRDIFVDMWYDGYGRVVKQNFPYPKPYDSEYLPRSEVMTNTQTSYELLGRTSQVKVVGGAVQDVQATYTYLDRQTQVQDGEGNTTTQRFDAWGRLVEVIPPTDGGQPLHPSVFYAYDTLDRLLTATRAGIVTSISYDLAGRKTAMSDPDMGSWSYAYDTLGNLTRQTDARGQRICLYYDQLNRLAGKHYRLDDACPSSNPTLDVEYRYDLPSSSYGIGHRSAMTDTLGVVSWNYDARGQVVDETRLVTGYGTFKTAWEYNSAGLLTSMTYPSGNTGQLGEEVSFSYHPQLRLEGMSSLDATYLQDSQYDEAGRIRERILGNDAILSTFEYYDWAYGGYLKALDSIDIDHPYPALQDMHYTYSDTGNILTIQDGVMSQTQTFSYDKMYRLLSAQASGSGQGLYPTEPYTYDPNTGNLASKNNISYTYGDPSHAHAVTSLSNGWSYVYDANGNMTQRNVNGQTYNLSYDAEGRMTGVSGAFTGSYGYNGDGQRVVVTEGITTTVYVGNLFEWNASSQTFVKYYYAGASRIAMRQGSSSEPLFILGDHLGSTSVIANYDGTRRGDAGYKAWGETRFITGEVPTDYRFTGQKEHAALGLYFYNARWYDPMLGRFVQADTVVPDKVNSQSWNRFAYVSNNPLKFIDPSGHTEISCGSDTGGSRYSRCTSSKTPVVIKNPKANAKLELYEYYLSLLEAFGWSLIGTNWTLEELYMLVQFAFLLQSVLGQDHFKKFFSGTTFAHGGCNKASCYPAQNLVKLEDNWLNDDQGWSPKLILAHELGHRLDYKTGSLIPAHWFGGGAGDDLTEFLGGEAEGIRWANELNINAEFKYTRPEEQVAFAANRSTADYFAHSFALYLLHPSIIKLKAKIFFDVLFQVY